ncbi:S8 family serine peptidase [Apibacter raozihei]|uniref:S8 family serine peptidase n=1 Tax=Apibacter raozihei TaxID=2500547 RepID=UPI000FE3D1E2|nr:S8 family serine peptidase [Apibacter raozihei]
MKKNLLFAFLAFYSLANSQTIEERKRVIETYDKEMQVSVERVINTFENERKSKIESYLIRNPDVKRQYVKDGIIYGIAEISEFGTPVFNRTFNQGAAQTIGANALQSGGELGLEINGENMVAGIWDGGIAMPNHVEFSGNRLIKKDSVANHYHATHVAGTIMAQGIDTKAKGMASVAKAHSYHWDNDIAAMQKFASQGYIVSNHSYGLASIHSSGYVLPTYYYGAYLASTYNADLVAYSNKSYQIVKSAGNDLDEWSYINPHKKGYELITAQGVAKNVLTVAAVENVSNYTGPSSVKLAYFSSPGPTDDGRIKPNIASKGVGVYSTYFDANNPTETNKYASMSGTSMASPGITGGVLLIQQYFNSLNGKFMKSATVRGLVQHTAKEAGDADGPDYRYGWGLADFKKSALTISGSKTGEAILEENILENGTDYTKEFNVNGDTEPLIVSISWTDLPAANYNSKRATDPDDIYLVNDLDVRVIDTQGNTYYPWKLNGKNPSLAATKGDNLVDNFERIDILKPVAGKYTVKVSHKGDLKELNAANSQVSGNQEYTLLVTGANIKTLGNEDISTTEFKTKIYPVPAHGNINVSVNQKVDFTIFDMAGKIISVGNLTDGENKVDITGLTTGVYLIKLNNGTKIETKKIIVQ